MQEKVDIVENLNTIRDGLPAHVQLIAVSKFHPYEAIKKLYDVGLRTFGESRMQELDAKHRQLPEDIEWHFIGHLQRNKVKDIIPYVHTIHSVDSVRLFREIDKEAQRLDKKVFCLIQIHIAEEENKYGFSFDECLEFLEKGEWRDCKYAQIGGLMGMSTLTEDEKTIRTEFKKLKGFFDRLKQSYFADDKYFSELSMGMSGDYQIAIEEGSTMVRIGTTIFGEREY